LNAPEFGDGQIQFNGSPDQRNVLVASTVKKGAHMFELAGRINF
jgi:hypothetical protein